MKFTSVIYVIIFFFFNFGFHKILTADEVRFIAKANKTEVQLGDFIIIQFSINTSFKKFEPPAFEGFRILSGPNQSSSVSIINGQISSSYTISYYLQPLSEGEYTIGPAKVLLSMGWIESNTIKIKVLPSSSTSNKNGGAQSNGSVSTQKPADVSNRYIFMDVSVSKKEAYIGEPLTVEYKLYTRVNIVDNELIKMPDLNGFYAQDEKSLQDQTEWRVEYVNGVPFNVATIKRTILIPQKTGLLKIDPFKMSFTVQQPSRSRPRSIWDEFFGSYENVKYDLSTREMTVKVKPLPDRNKPLNFIDAVGNYKLVNSISRTSVKANESIDYTIEIEGSGNINLLTPPTIEFPEEFEVYEPDVKNNTYISGNSIQGKKIIKYLLVPRVAGKYTIPAPEFSFFNPATGKYVTLKGDSFIVDVQKGDHSGSALPINPNAAKINIKSSGKAFNYIRENFRDAPIFLISRIWYWVAVSLCFLFMIAGKIWQVRYFKLLSDREYVFAKKSEKAAMNWLKEAEKLLKDDKNRQFYSVLYKALVEYLSGKLKIDKATFTNETAFNLLKNKIDQSQLDILKEIFDQCQLAGFGGMNQADAKDLFLKAKNWIKTNDKKLNV